MSRKDGAPHGNLRYTEEHKQTARLAFIQDGKTFEDIALLIGSQPRTVSTWAAKEGWKEQRRAWCQERGTPLEELEERAYRKALRAVNDKAETMTTAELLAAFGTLNKFKSMLAKSAGVRLLDAVLAVSPAFEAFALEAMPEQARDLIGAWKVFVEDTGRRS